MGERRGEAVCEPEMRVGLRQRRRDAAQTGGEHHRPGHVSPGTEHHVRPPPVEDAEHANGAPRRLNARTSSIPGRRGKPEIENESNS